MTDKRQDNVPEWRNFYGRRHGKKLRKGQIEHLERTLPEIAVPGVERDENPERKPIGIEALFGRDMPIWLEVGFGSGEHLLQLAQDNPDVGFIGCEPFINGVAVLVPRVADLGLTNVRIHPGDARDLLDLLPAGSIERAFLLYPDPWPKKRHHRRRFVTPEHLDPLSEALKSGARFHIATDIGDYVRQSLEQMLPRPEFSWTAETAADWREPWSDWHRTRYEAKAVREGRTPHYLTFVKS
jgi:tRNA (guanine-N7-)-methyltransferase